MEFIRYWTTTQGPVREHRGQDLGPIVSFAASLLHILPHTRSKLHALQCVTRMYLTNQRLVLRAPQFTLTVLSFVHREAC